MNKVCKVHRSQIFFPFPLVVVDVFIFFFKESLQKKDISFPVVVVVFCASQVSLAEKRYPALAKGTFVMIVLSYWCFFLKELYA